MKPAVILIAFLLTFFVTLSAQQPIQLNINQGISSGSISATVNTNFSIGTLSNIFDGNINTLAVTPSVNPLVITLHFQSNQVRLVRMRFYAATVGRYRVECAQTLNDLNSGTGTYRLVINNYDLAPNTWGTQNFTPTDARFVRLTAQRTAGDNFVHLNEWELYVDGSITSIQFPTDTLVLYTGWTWRHLRLLGNSASGQVQIPMSQVSITSSNPAVASVNAQQHVSAVSAGTAILTATYNSLQTTLPVAVRTPARTPDVVSMPPGLSSPAPNAVYPVPVIIIRYIPTVNGTTIDRRHTTAFPNDYPIQRLVDSINLYDKAVVFALTEGSKFRGYQNPNARPSLGYYVSKYITVYEPMPPGDSVFSVVNNRIKVSIDYRQIIQRFNLQTDINQGLAKEIWMWYLEAEPDSPYYSPSIHRPEIFRGGWESNMASPTTGDVSNSDRNPGDLPVFSKTYVWYLQNSTRTQAEAIHNHGHQLESIYAFVNQRQDGNTNLFWGSFVGRTPSFVYTTGRAGWTHMPPNTTQHYDYLNPTLVLSDIADWQPNGGQQTLVNRDTWGNQPYSWPAGTARQQRIESNWYIYWFQSMPGYGNRIRYGNFYMTNWWEFTAHWDSVITRNLGLYSSVPTVSTPERTPVSTYRLMQNYPNPFNPATVIQYELPRTSRVKLEVFDMLGRKLSTLVDARQEAGTYSVGFNADTYGLSSGIYFYRFETEGFSETRKMIFAK